MPRTGKHIILLFAVLMILSSFLVGGAYAAWMYTEDPIESVDEFMGIQLSVFEYTPEEVLPGGTIEKPEMGQNHFALIDLILNENDKGYGLNINDSVVLHDYLNEYNVVYSNQKVSGGNLKFIIDPQNNTHGLYYCLEKISDSEYYAYTFSTDLLSSAGPTGGEIEAYRTILKKTDKWNATTSHLGYARTRLLSYLGVSADPNSIPYSLEMSTWRYY